MRSVNPVTDESHPARLRSKIRPCWFDKLADKSINPRESYSCIQFMFKFTIICNEMIYDNIWFIGKMLKTVYLKFLLIEK